MKSRIALALAGVALISLPAMAQTANPPGVRENAATVQTQLKPGEWPATKLVGLNVYNSHDEKIGAVDQLIVTKDGTVESLVVGAGGFLGMGQHDVAVPFKDVTWSDKAVASTTSGTAAPTSGTAAPTSGIAAPPSAARQDMRRGYPDHAVLDMTKEQLKQLPEVSY